MDNSFKEREEIIATFGKEKSLIVLDYMLKRDKQWIELLVEKYPNDWEISDYEKSVALFDSAKEKIKSHL